MKGTDPVSWALLLLLLCAVACAGDPSAKVADSPDSPAAATANGNDTAETKDDDAVTNAADVADASPPGSEPCTWSNAKHAAKDFTTGTALPPSSEDGFYTAPKFACKFDSAPLTESLPTPVGAILVDDHGLKGDGKTDDAPALTALLKSAGEDAVVAFTGGKIYRLCRTAFLHKGQRLTRVGKGEAVLKRCDEVTTTLKKAAAKGATFIEVADVSKFDLGLKLTVVVTGSAGGHNDVSTIVHPILSIKGDVIELYKGLSRAFDAGDTVVQSYDMIGARFANSRVDHLVFDGNRANNTKVSFWEGNRFGVIGDEAFKADGFVVEDCAFRNGPGDGFSVTKCHNCKIRRCLFEDLNGAAAHLSSALNVEFAHNVVRRVCANAELAHHTESAVTWSLFVKDPWVHHNCIEDSPTGAFGILFPAPSAKGGSVGAKIELNVIQRTKGFLFASNVKLNTKMVNPITIQDNVCVDCGRLYMRGSQSPTGKLLTGVKIQRNILFGGGIQLESVADTLVQDNLVVAHDLAEVWKAEKTYDQAGFPLLRLERAVDTTVQGNAFVGGERGIWLRVIGGVNTGTKITKNTFLGQSESGLTTGDFGHISSPTSVYGKTPGVAYSHNTFAPSFAAASERSAAYLGQHSTFIRNCVTSPANGIMVYGHNGDGGKHETRVDNNRFAGNEAALTVGEIGGLTVSNNTYAGSVSPKLVAAATTVVSGNVAGPVACDVCWPTQKVLSWIPKGVPAEVQP